tara:strand:- start:627 stop:830 length:204 start_codon:yes stop_codon:yes gene_type:complete
MKGFLLTVVIDDDLFLLEFFNFLRIGVAWKNNETGRATALILGLYKIETNITLALRKKFEFYEVGEA